MRPKTLRRISGFLLSIILTMLSWLCSSESADSELVSIRFFRQNFSSNFYFQFNKIWVSNFVILDCRIKFSTSSSLLSFSSLFWNLKCGLMVLLWRLSPRLRHHINVKRYFKMRQAEYLNCDRFTIVLITVSRSISSSLLTESSPLFSSFQKQFFVRVVLDFFFFNFLDCPRSLDISSGVKKESLISSFSLNLDFTFTQLCSH